jgi:hypothetical protein
MSEIKQSLVSALQRHKVNYMALSLNDEINHAKFMQIKYQCQKCLRFYKTKHPGLCHIPKCKGPAQADEGANICAECGKAFSSKNGLSQHERHEHPLLRNATRRTEFEKSTREPKGFGQVWSKE